MKHTLRFTLALVLLATMILSCSVLAFAADVEGTIVIDDEATLVQDKTYDLEDAQKVNLSGTEDVLQFGEKLGRKYPYNEVTSYKDPNNTYITNDFGTNVPGNSTKAYSVSYAVGAEEYRQTELRIKTAKLVKDLSVEEDEYGSKYFAYTPQVYDYLTFSFDLYLKDNPRNFYVRLSNSPEALLMYIDPVGDVYLRGLGGGTSTDPNPDYDVKIGQVTYGEWNTFSITFFPQRGTVGYYDYSIAMNGETLTTDGSMYIVAGIVDDADFQMDGTQLTLGCAPSPIAIEKACTWAVDNIRFQTYAYTGDPADVEADIPAVSESSSSAFVDVWTSSDWSADSIFNIRAGATIINTNFAIQLPGVAGATASDPAWQKKGGYTSADYTLSMSADGQLTVKKADGGNLIVPLYKRNGNINLSADTISANYRVAFTFIFNGDNAPTASLGGTALNIPVASVIKGANRAVLTVRGTVAELSINGGAPATTTVPAAAADTALVIGLPAGKAVTFSDFAIAEEQTVKVHTIQLNGQTVEIDAARANYLKYLAAKAAAAPGTEIKAKDYETLDRRAVRPVGDVIFDSAEFYYDPEAKVQVNSWGTSVNNAWTNEVTYWGTSKAAPDAETGEETNGYLLGYFQLYMEDGAVVSQINRADLEKNPNGYTYTAGVQANLMKENGLKDRMPQDHASEYFRYSFSIWYDPTTFAQGVDDAGNERKVTVRLGQRGAAPAVDETTGEAPEFGPDVVGDNWLRGQMMFTIDGNGTLTIPTYRYGTDLVKTDNGDGTFSYSYTPMAQETSVALETGWNTIEMLFVKEGLWVGEETVTGNGKNGPITQTLEVTHAYFTMQYTINGDLIYHDKTDEETGMNFIFDNGRDPCSQNVYLEILAILFSNGTEKETELQRLKVKDWKYEFCTDQEIDVNCYIKGTSGSEVLAFTDFTEQDGRTDPKVYAGAADTVEFINRNERLMVNHKAAASTAKVGYFYDADLLADGPVTFDASLYLDNTAPVVNIATGTTTLVTVENGFVSVLGNTLATAKKSGWNNLSVVFEKDGSTVLLTVYVQGEIVLFRAPTDLTEVKDVYVASTGNAGQGYKVDNLSIAQDIIPTSIVYMMPVTYVNEGQTSAGNYEAIHFIGSESTLFPTAAKEGAVFEGWYFDQAFTAKASRIKMSYTKPVVLYAKYNYRVSYTMGTVSGNAPNAVSTYGDIVLPYADGVVYWHAVVDGKDVYYTPDSVFKVLDNVTFEALDATAAANADFIISVNRIDPTANYETVAGLVNGIEGNPDEEIEEVIGALEYYALADANNAAVKAAKSTLDSIVAGLEAKDAAAAEYLAKLAVVTDGNKTYAERYAAYVEMTVTVDADGKTWRQRMDATTPGVFEANSQLIASNMDFERAQSAAVELALAVEAYKAAGTLSGEEKYEYLSAIYEAYIYCFETAEYALVSTYVYTAEDLAGVAAPKTVAEYLTAAEAEIDAYNNQITVYNNEILGAQVAAASISFKTTAAMAIKAAVDQFKADVALIPRED